MSERATEEFLGKIDAFAASLEPGERIALAELLGQGSDDVVGFGPTDWPGVKNLLAPSITTQIDGFLSSGHATGSNVASSAGADPDGRNFGTTAGGDPNV